MKTIQMIFSLVSLLLFSLTGTTVKASEVTTASIVDLKYLQGRHLVATVKYTSGCYEPYAEVHGVESADLVLVHLAEKESRICTQAITTQKVYFDLSDTPNGVYNVIDGHDGDELGVLWLKKDQKNVIVQ